MGEPPSGGSPIVYNFASFCRSAAGRPPASGENPAAYPAIPPVSERTRNRNGEDGTRRYSGSNACPIFCRSPARSFSVDSLSAYGQTHEPDVRGRVRSLTKKAPRFREASIFRSIHTVPDYSLVYQTCLPLPALRRRQNRVWQATPDERHEPKKRPRKPKAYNRDAVYATGSYSR